MFKNTKKINKKLSKKLSRKLSNKTLQSKKPYSKLLLGCHVSISPSILDGIKWGESIGSNAIQLFLGSNRSASMKTKAKPTIDEITTIRNYIHINRIIVIIHSIYLLNFCKAPSTSGKVKYMHENIQYDLKLGSQLGAKCVILHLGFATDLERSIAITNLTDNLNKILDNKPDNIQLVIETSAGQGSQIGYTLEELEIIWSKIKHHGSHNISICIDTAHIFVSGYDISTLEGIKSYLEKFNSLIGWEYISVFHLNDSRWDMGSRKDEHRGIGFGKIFQSVNGKTALDYLIRFGIKHKIPIILETHSAGSPRSENSQHVISKNKRLSKPSYLGEHGYQWEISMIRARTDD